jgi:hypothetical protein
MREIADCGLWIASWSWEVVPPLVPTPGNPPSAIPNPQWEESAIRNPQSAIDPT